MKRLKYLFLSFLIFIGSIIGFISPVSAAQNPADFDISPVMPSNQKKGVSGYYDLIVQPNQTQTLTFKINNNSNRRNTYEVSFAPAMTSDGGAIDYSNPKAKIDKTVAFDIRNAVKLSDTSYAVNPRSSVSVPVTVKVPNKIWTGRVLGGITIQKVGEGTKTGKASNATLRTKVSYSIAVVLQNKEEIITPDLSYLKTAPEKVNGYASLQMSFRNPIPTIIPDLIFKTVVKKDGKKYIENTSNKYTVAPNTKFHVNLGLDGHRVEPGKYTVDVVAKSGAFYKWHFTDKFEIKKNRAEEVNKNAIFPDDNGLELWKIIAIISIIVFLIALLIIYLLWKKQKKNTDED